MAISSFFETNPEFIPSSFVASLNSKAADTRATLAAFDNKQYKAAFVYNEGWRNGFFVWSPANHAGDIARDLTHGVYVAPSTDATGASGAWVRVFAGEVNAQWFGAVPDGATSLPTDSTNAVQYAVYFFPSGNGSIRLPVGTYKITAQINVNQSRIRIVGDGKGVTLLRFMPSTNSTMFRFEAADSSSVIYNCAVKDLSIYSTDITYQKIGFMLVDHSAFQFHSVGTISPHWTGNQSIFAYHQGRELFSGRDWDAYADTVIWLAKVPTTHSSHNIVAIDQFNFHNMYLGSMAGLYPLIYVADGTWLTNVSFTGFQSWVGATHGFEWEDTSTTSISNNVLFENVRTEQGLDATKYVWYFNRSAVNCLTVTFRNCYPGDRKGLYLRKCLNVLMHGIPYSAACEVLNADNTVGSIDGRGVIPVAGSTAVITGLTLKSSSGDTGALPHTFYYDQSPGNPVTTGPIARGPSYSIANNGTQDLDLSIGFIFVVCSDQTSAQFAATGGLASQKLNDWNGDYSVTSGNAGTSNLFWNAGTGKYRLENKRGSTLTYTIFQIG